MSKLKLGTVSLTFKTPGVLDGIAEETLKGLMRGRAQESEEGQEEDPIDAAEDWDHFHDRITETLRKFVKYGEYIRVEIDLDNGTAQVLPAK